MIVLRATLFLTAKVNHVYSQQKRVGLKLIVELQEEEGWSIFYVVNATGLTILFKSAKD